MNVSALLIAPPFFRSTRLCFRSINRTCLLAFISLLILNNASAQQKDILQYVNPFIGTTTSNVFTRWGNEGGTYPGAVAPWSFFQLSPETAGGHGYDYKDSAISYFSCLQHHSGYPGGSGGSLRLMPVTGEESISQNRPFRHEDEKAEPGYYRVLFRDNGTLVEATATTHAGLFRIHFPSGVLPALFIGNAGEISPASSTELEGRMIRNFKRYNQVISDTQRIIIFRFNRNIAETKKLEGGYFIRFTPEAEGSTVLTVELSASPASFESARDNIESELSTYSFDQVRARTQSEWTRQLSVVSIHDPSEKNKTTFYTALYHSLLLPWIVSDVNGVYRGADRKLHKTSARAEYAGFSPWDTYRTLHPLLTLLYPQRQADMLSSIMDIYRQSGYLPTGPMTGNHSIPIVVDSYLKGIKNLDSTELYKAMKKSLVTGPFIQRDMKLYEQGFIPHPNTESVTRTVEYTYDDWALAQFAGKVMHDQKIYAYLMQRSRNYRNLFNTDELSLLPRKGNTFYHGTGNAGYKEGDQWVYTYSLPQYQRDLINLLGGDQNFTRELDSALKDNRIVFDNETVFHVPYLFNSTAYPYKSRQWIHNIMQDRFSDSPGGLPGNDDLGATSSWYVWSALGLFPVCPGDPVYAIGTPLFKEATLSLAGGKKWKILAENGSPKNFYVKAIEVNGHLYSGKWLPHADLIRGGRILFKMSGTPDKEKQPGSMPGETDSSMRISLSGFSVTSRRVNPNDLLWIKFNLRNTGALGTAIVRLRINDSILVQKNFFTQSRASRQDSIPFRLYAYGKNKLQIEGYPAMDVSVIKPGFSIKVDPEIISLEASPLTPKDSLLYYRYTVKNTGGNRQRFMIPVKLDDQVIQQDTVVLNPGDSCIRKHILAAALADGIHLLKVSDKTAKAKVYTSAPGALVLDMPEEMQFTKPVKDQSGFGNDGWKAEEGNYIALPHTPSLDSNGRTLTMMAWIYDPGSKRGLIDLMAKGDNHVLQLSGGRLSFFAGGWGRGDVKVSLPDDWQNHWHHIAGVCTGPKLQLYIDGALKGETAVDEVPSLNVAAGWTIGSNEEFPLNRTFNGKIRNVKIYAAPLSENDIKAIYLKEKPAMNP